MNKRSLVKKSNSLITARYDLPIIEQKLVLSVISMVNREDEDFKDYRFYIKDFFKVSDINSGENYTYIKNSFKSLLSKTLEIKKENGGWLLVNWLSSAESDNKGFVDVCFDPKLKPYLLKLKECFTSYELKNILFLHSIYSVRIYEMLKQYESTGIKRMSIDELRDILKTSKSYTISNINQRILKAAQKELKELTDIEFTYEFKKRGNKFTDITFKIKRNAKMPALLQNDKDKNEGQTAPPNQWQRQDGVCDSPLSLEEEAAICFKKFMETGKCYKKDDGEMFLSRCKFCKLKLMVWYD